MIFRILGLWLMLFTTVAFAEGRKPAVEDFVGIEVDQAEAAPSGSEILYNLEQDLTKIGAQKNKPATKTTAPVITASSWSMTTILSITFVLSLPLIMWLTMMSHLKKKASVESASNIEVLEKYRKDRENKTKDNIKKAS